ncbi:MAG: DUF4062 domain-containing protein [Candidatus Limiplasma sp.]|nr:DUF4062 domain-containing protein [Candidatus Limiplasma sp.]
MKKIFVSSTFRDMQAERDILHLVVLPEVNEYAAQFGQSVGISDLRWGIDTSRLTEEESSRKVLSVCFEQIEECKPYMIVLLGERYGFVPEPAVGGDAAGLSVTEMEILFGALSQEDLSRCAFYFREPLRDPAMGADAADYADADEAQQARMTALKRKIEAAAPGRIRHYSATWDAQTRRVTGLDDFAHRVADDIRAMMLDEWRQQAALTPEALERNAAWQTLQAKAAGFTARRALEAEVRTELSTGRAGVTLLTGAPGSGKSSLLAAVALRLQTEGWQVFPFVAGGGGSYTVTDLLRQIDAFLAPLVGQPLPAQNSTGKALSDAFERLAAACASLPQRMLLAIDALDQMADSDTLREFSWLPPVLPANLRILATCTDDYPLPRGLPYSIPDRRFALPPLDAQTERRALVEGLTAAAGKTLPAEVTDALVRLPAAASPLYLSMFVQRLLMLNATDFGNIRTLGQDGNAISAYLLHLVTQAPPDVAGMCAAILAEAAQRIQPEQLEPTLGLLAVSRRGLRETDLAALLATLGIPFVAVDHARLRKYMRPFFLNREDGRLDFSHRAIREGFLARLEKPSALEEPLLKYLLQLPVNDPLRQSELPAHTMHLDRKDALFGVLIRHEDAPAMQRSLHDLTLTDRGIWLRSLLGCADSDANLLKFAQAMLRLEGAYQTSTEELAALTPLLEATLGALRNRNKRALAAAGGNDILFKLLFVLGRAYYAQGMTNYALVCYTQSEALLKSAGSPLRKRDTQPSAATPDILWDGEPYTQEQMLWLARSHMLEEQGHAHNRLRQLDAALDCYRQSHALMCKLLPDAERHPSLWQALAVGCSELCRVSGRLKHFDEAATFAAEGIRYAEKAVELDPCVESTRALAALHSDQGDAYSSVQRWEEAYDAHYEAYQLSAELVRTRNDAQSRLDLAFSARKRGDMLARMALVTDAKELYLESLKLAAYAPETLMAPEVRRMLRDTATNYGFLRMVDWQGDAPFYNAVARMLTLLDGFTENAAGTDAYRNDHGLLCDALSLVLRLGGCTAEADALRRASGESLREAKAESIPEDNGALEAEAARLVATGKALIAAGQPAEARVPLQQAAELYVALDTRQPTFSPRVAKLRTDVIFLLGQTYLPEKNYGEMASHFEFCYKQYERIYTQTHSDEAQLDRVALRRASATLLDLLGKEKDAVGWMQEALSYLEVAFQPESAQQALVETARCAQTAASLHRTGRAERKKYLQQAAQCWQKAYAAERDPAYLAQAEACEQALRR